jgi:RNA recognition motif-containing protein
MQVVPLFARGIICHPSFSALSIFRFPFQEHARMAKKLYVGNLSYNTNRPKGFGFVEMATEDGAREAIKRFNGYSLDNRALTVNEARPREERSGGSYGGGGGYGGGGYGGSGGGQRRDNRSSGGGGGRNRF